MVHHLKRGKARRGRLTLPDLVGDVSQASLQAETSGERKDQGNPDGSATVAEGNLFSPLSKAWGAAKSGRDKEMHTPPPSCCVRLPG
jgi:hypothetical protein